MRKPFFKRRAVRVLLVLLGAGILSVLTFFWCLFYVPTLPPIESLTSYGAGGVSMDPAEPLIRVQTQIHQLTLEAQQGKEKDYELAVSDIEINRIIQRVMEGGNFPGHQYTEQAQVKFENGEVKAISISPIAALAARWRAIHEYLPEGLSSSQRLIAVTVRLRPTQVSDDTVTLEPQGVWVGKVKLPAYVVNNVIEKVGARVGIGPEERTVQVPGKIQEVSVADGWFKVRARTQLPGDPQGYLKGGNAKVEKLLNRFLEMLRQRG
jgi:hypothetical protein